MTIECAENQLSRIANALEEIARKMDYLEELSEELTYIKKLYRLHTTQQIFTAGNARL